MPTYPYTIDNGHGELLTFTGVTASADGGRIEIDGAAQPGAGPPMHVHYLQDESVRVISGRVGYQEPGSEAKFGEAGDVVTWPAGVAHRWWNAGTGEVRMTGWCSPPGNVEFYLGAIFASMKENGGGRPGLFDAAYLAVRYGSEFEMLAVPLFVRRVIVPIAYALGRVLGKHRKFADAPQPIAARL